jgi:cytidine deaminase
MKRYYLNDNSKMRKDIELYTIKSQIEIYNSQNGLAEDEKELVIAARNAMLKAYPPYSNYYVGAAVRVADGNIFTGSNQENVSYGLTVCAERSALFHVGSSGQAKNVVKLAVIGRPKQKIDKKVEKEEELLGGPCGACRQVIKEYEDLSGNPLVILCVLNTDRVYRAVGIETLLPMAFGPRNIQADKPWEYIKE